MAQNVKSNRILKKSDMIIPHPTRMRSMSNNNSIVK
jgi:hypothetical protein